MTDDDDSYPPPWTVSSLADALTALRAELSAGMPASAELEGIAVTEVAAEFSVGLARDGHGKLGWWVAATGEADTQAPATLHRVTLRLARTGPPGSASGRSPWTVESTRGEDTSLHYAITDEPTPDAAPTRGWDEGDPL
jgi:hypothetical protein